MFRNRFLEAVEGRKDLAPHHKFQYLLQYLTGEPHRLADSYYVSDESYFEVLDRLEERYGNRNVLSTILVQDLFDLKPAGQHVNDLRRFHDDARRIASELKMNGEDVDANIVCKTTLTSKLSAALRTEIFKSLGRDALNASFTEILCRLSEHIFALEASELVTSWKSVFLTGGSTPTTDEMHRSVAVDTSDLSDQPCRDGPELKPIEPAVNVQRVTAAVPTTNADDLLQERRTCPLCRYLHSAANCTVYVTARTRTRRALKLKLCLLCLREGHPAVSCPRRTTQPCKTCRHGQHSRALCLAATGEMQSRDRRPSPMRATRGLNLHPEASDHQRHSRTRAPASTNRRIAEPSVIRDDMNLMPTATTLRPSGTQSSRVNLPGNLMNRKKKPKDLGTDPLGRAGTNRPPTTSTDESMMQNGADAYGRARLLPRRDDLLRTDRCLTESELQFELQTAYGSARLAAELIEEDFSHQTSDGHCSDASFDAPEDWFPPYEECTAYVACASVNGPQQRAPTNLVGPSAVPSSADEPPDVLHECLAVTAMNPVSKTSRRAVIMFDSFSSFSLVSSKLARTLDLPRHKKRVQMVSTFGSKTPMALNGFRTFLVLRSQHGRCLQVNVTVIDCIVSSVRTALVRDADLPALRRNDCTPTSTREMPDLLIGQDLVHLFEATATLPLR